MKRFTLIVKLNIYIIKIQFKNCDIIRLKEMKATDWYLNCLSQSAVTRHSKEYNL